MRWPPYVRDRHADRSRSTAGVLGSVWFYRQLRDPQAAVAAADPDAARDTLRQRFAAGEIDDDEYERRLSALTHWR